MRSKKRWLLAIPLLLAIFYLMGPRPAVPHYSQVMPVVPTSPDLLEQYIREKESRHHIKPDNEARIIWYNDSMRQKTKYAIVYLHGFSASQREGGPVHTDIARRFGCNLFLTRLSQHGLDTSEALKGLTVDGYWESAKEALAIGKQLGEKVILMGTSTGGSQALQLAAIYPKDVYALVLMSPNIAINDPNAWLLNNPWGLQIARLVIEGDYIDSKDTRPIYRQYWYGHYRLEGAVALQEMLETSMTAATFKKVKQPLLLLYYYKDKVHQDSVVKVSAMLDMFKELGTPANEKFSQAMPKAGNHVLGSDIKSTDIPGVEQAIEQFMERVIK